MWGFDEKSLVGQVVSGVAVSDDKERLLITLKDGRTAEFVTDGDCCSYTWIEHTTIPLDIDGATITTVKESESVEATPEQYQEMRDSGEYTDVVAVYHTSFVTDRGEIIVEYRNNSNGYYGGSLLGPSFR